MSGCLHALQGVHLVQGLGVTWRNIVLGQRDNPLGMGSTVPLGTVPLVIPFPQKGNGILFLCGFMFPIIIVVVVVVKIPSFFKISQ